MLREGNQKYQPRSGAAAITSSSVRYLCPHMLRSDHRELRAKLSLCGGWWWVGGGMRPNTATSRSFACFCFYDLVNLL